jgi:hypothetical protein
MTIDHVGPIMVCSLPKSCLGMHVPQHGSTQHVQRHHVDHLGLVFGVCSLRKLCLRMHVPQHRSTQHVQRHHVERVGRSHRGANWRAPAQGMGGREGRKGATQDCHAINITSRQTLSPGAKTAPPLLRQSPGIARLSGRGMPVIPLREPRHYSTAQ